MAPCGLQSASLTPSSYIAPQMSPYGLSSMQVVR
jgi:hypothetical protein